MVKRTISTGGLRIRPLLGKIVPMLVFLVFVCLLCACQPADSEIPDTVEGATTTQSDQTIVSEKPAEDSTEDESSAEEQSPEEGDPEEPDAQEPEVEEPETEPSSDPVAASGDIQAAWESSAHANTYVLNDLGGNMKCARCHAPTNWIPSIDDVPEACLACKFELKEPPPLVPEGEWEHIPCRYCHEEDRRGNINPEIAWLEIAQIGEYSDVATPTELCLKCHNEIDLPEHALAEVGGAHADYECTECHDAHDTVASCTAAGCHDDVIDPASPIPGHDDDHQLVTCVACHDAGGLEVGPVEESGLWMTFFTVLSPEGEASVVPFTSHNTVLEAPCERCHFAGNPWGLSAPVSSAP